MGEILVGFAAGVAVNVAILALIAIYFTNKPRRLGYNPPPVGNVKRPIPTPAPPPKRYG